MFEKHEISIDRRAVLRLPVLEGNYFRVSLPSEFCLASRIARPHLSKDVFELRSAQARTPGHESTHFFDAQNRLIGRRVQQPFHSTLSEVPEGAEAYQSSLLSVGGTTSSFVSGLPDRVSGNVTHITHEAASASGTQTSWVMGSGRASATPSGVLIDFPPGATIARRSVTTVDTFAVLHPGQEDGYEAGEYAD